VSGRYSSKERRYRSSDLLLNVLHRKEGDFGALTLKKGTRSKRQQ
jgi:hypothetical protein